MNKSLKHGSKSCYILQSFTFAPRALMFLLEIVKTIICRKLIRIETNQNFLKNKILSVFVLIKKTKLGYWTIQVFLKSTTEP